MEVGFAIDPAQALSPEDELGCVRFAAELGYRSAWTPGRGDASAFERCRAWFAATGLPTGIAVVPASAQEARFYAEQASRLWRETEGNFVLGVGSGQLEHAARSMPAYLDRLRELLPAGAPVYLAALGPQLLRLAAVGADGVCLNWCSAKQAAWSRRVVAGATPAGRLGPPIVEYVRVAVDPDRALARRVAERAMLQYAEGPAAYRSHFARMGLTAPDPAGGTARPDAVDQVAAFGAPGEVRARFLDLAADLDLALVRVLVSSPGDAASARRTLEECRPS